MFKIADLSDFINQQVKWRLQKELQELHERVKGSLKVRDAYQNQLEDLEDAFKDQIKDLEDRIQQQSEKIIFLSKAKHELETKLYESESNNEVIKELLVKSKEALIELNDEVNDFKEDTRVKYDSLAVFFESNVQETLDKTRKMRNIQRNLNTLIDENEIYKSKCSESKFKQKQLK